MQTRSHAGIFKPNPKYALTSKSPTTQPAISPIPKSVRTLQDPHWRAAMADEFGALQCNHTWRLVDRPLGANIISRKWVFNHKLKPDGSLEHYKARWVVRGFMQRPGVDFGETFTPVVKPATIQTVLTIAASKNWPTKQLLHQRTGQPNNWMSPMLSYTVISRNMSFVSSRPVLSIHRNPTPSVY
jgi:hypothetical protein